MFDYLLYQVCLIFFNYVGFYTYFLISVYILHIYIIFFMTGEFFFCIFIISNFIIYHLYSIIYLNIFVLFSLYLSLRLSTLTRSASRERGFDEVSGRHAGFSQGEKREEET